jgi:uncharacterized FAD-dependent dehydrogenase
LNFDVVVVGAGPAGLFAAYEIANNSNLKILVIDKGKDINNRVCPSISELQRCLKCKPCSILCGLGGAGGLSDGKLNLKPDVGGNLEEFVPKEEANKLVKQIDDIFLEHGASPRLYGDDSHDLEKKAAEAGIEFIPIPQRHIGSDMLPVVVTSIKNYLLDKNVEFLLNTNVEKIEKNNNFRLILDDDMPVEARFVIAATGRSGADWISSEAKRLGITTRFAPIDIGVRVEVPAVVMENIIEFAWDPKFHIYTKKYDDFVRTFCTCPNGFVVMEDYGDYVGVNGHSSNTEKSENTNFAFLTRIELTEPVENTTEYGASIAKLATTIGGRMPIIQRLEDLRSGHRSTASRIEKSFVKPTFKNATPGDISMAMPHRIVDNVIEGLEQLDKVIPGVNSDSTLLYAPEIKFYSMRFIVNKNLETNIPNFFTAGDGAGLSRGIVASAATGIIAARGILKKVLNVNEKNIE